MLASAVRLEANTTSVMPGCFLHPSRMLYFWLVKDSSWDSQSSSLQKQACLFSYADFTLQRGPHHSSPFTCAIQPFPPAPSLPAWRIQQCLAPPSVTSASCLCCCLSQIAISYVRFDSFPCLDALLNLRPALMSALSWSAGLIGPSLENWEWISLKLNALKVSSSHLSPSTADFFFLSVKMLWVFQGRQSCLRPET